MQLIMPGLILRLVDETDPAAAVISLAIKDPVSKEQAHNKFASAAKRLNAVTKSFSISVKKTNSCRM